MDTTRNIFKLNSEFGNNEAIMRRITIEMIVRIAIDTDATNVDTIADSLKLTVASEKGEHTLGPEISDVYEISCTDIP